MSLEVTEHQIADETETCCGSSRRALLRAAGVGGAAAAVGLTAAACGSSSGTANTASNNNAGSASTTDPATSAAASSTASAASGGSGSALAATSDVPVEGGKIVTASGGVVITQPASGTFKAFTAVCTHQQCAVGSVSGNVITCPCHGSQFSAKDGSVVQGPASSPLAAKNITVSGGQIFLA
jgi:nitrite reductase/ring-hydroxylating ferredoxin subunit